MLAGGTDLLYRQALAAGHEPYVRIEVWRADERLETDLVFVNGTVTATLTSRVARTCTLTVHEDLYPFNDDGLLNPFGNELRVFAGVVFADGERYIWPVFVGKIVEAALGEGDCQIVASDRAAEVEDAAFIAPENSTVGAPVVDEFQRLVSDGVPGALFGTSDSFFQVMPVLTWEHDRAGALDEMATSVGAFWYPLADGQFVLRKIPWTVAGEPLVTLTDEDGGSITSSSAVRSRETVFNSVTVTGERPDGTVPVFHTAEDSNPDSPTYTGGPFGVRNKLVQLDTPSTPDGAREAAESYLRRTTAFTEAWTFSCAPDAALELGDILRLDVRGRVDIRQVVASFSLPLTPGNEMRVQCRAQVIGALEAVA